MPATAPKSPTPEPGHLLDADIGLFSEIARVLREGGEMGEATARALDVAISNLENGYGDMAFRAAIRARGYLIPMPVMLHDPRSLQGRDDRIFYVLLRRGEELPQAIERAGVTYIRQERAGHGVSLYVRVQPTSIT